MIDTTIVFVGDWIRLDDEWHRVLDINGQDQCQILHPLRGVQWIYADNQHIDQVLSDREMKERLQPTS
jgi:hypothetical protein